MVNAGDEKKIAVQSPSGILATASNIARSRNPPNTPWAPMRHLVAKSGVPHRLCFPITMMGIMVASWARHLTSSSCQEFTLGMYFTITLLEVKQRPDRMAQQ